MKHVFILGLLLTGLAGRSAAQLYMPFKVRYQTTQRGGVTMIGNGFLTATTLPLANSQVPPGGTGVNNAYAMMPIDADGAAFPTTFSSYDTLKLQPSSGILFAGLYWGGNATETVVNKHKIKLRGPGDAGYTDVTGTVIGTGAANSLFLYQSFADVTDFVRARGNGRYAAADPVVRTGGSNLSAGWSLVIVYADANLAQRKLAVYDGLANLNQTLFPTYTYPLTDFITPASGAVSVEIGTVAYDGDRGSTGDQLLFKGNSKPTYLSLGNSINPANDIFNSTISSNNTVRNTQVPYYPNTLGYDQDIFVPDNPGNTFIGNNETAAGLQFTSTGDNFTVAVVTLALNAAEPDFTLTKGVVDLNGGTLTPGDTVQYTINLAYSGTAEANRTVLTDTLPYNLNYAPGSLRILNGAQAGAKTDAAGDDVGEYIAAKRTVSVNLGAGANATAGGMYNATSGTNPVSVRFKATVSTDCHLLSCGSVVFNEAVLNYTGSASGTVLTLQSVPASGAPSTGKTALPIGPNSCSVPGDTLINAACPGTPFVIPNPLFPGYDFFMDAACTQPFPFTALEFNTDYYARKSLTGTTLCPVVRKVRIAKLNAGPDLGICNDVSMVDLPDAPAGATWSARPGNPVGASISTPSGIVFNLLLPGTYAYILANPTTTCRDTVFLRRGDPTVNAGVDLFACQDTPVKLSGAALGGSAVTGAWSITAVTGTMSVDPSQLSTTAQTPYFNEVIFTPFPGTSGSVTLQLTGNAPTGSCSAVSASRVLTVTPKTVTNAGGNNLACVGTTLTLSDAAVTGTTGSQAAWSLVSGSGTLSSTAQTPDPQTVTFTPTAAGTNVLRLTSTTGCAATYDERTVLAFATPATPTVSGGTACEGATLNLSAGSATPGADYVWTYPGGGTSTVQNPSFANATPALNGMYTVRAASSICVSAAANLPVTVFLKTASVLTQTACSSYTLNGSTYTASGTYTQVRPNAKGCDSTITLNLTILQPTASSLTQTACDSYTLNGQTYTASGTYTQVRPNARGCDSTITLNLTIHPSTSVTLTQTACSLYTLNGNTYTTSGSYTQYRTNAKGCDSTITLNLTINQPTSATLTQTACSSYTLNGSTYTASGTYVQHRLNAKGCDSTITLNLTIHQPTASTLTQTACSSFMLNGTTYTASGSYTQVRPNAKGCDSTITLNLTIHQPTSAMLTQTACSSYTLNGNTYTASGTYVQHRTNAKGCDSTITLNLTIHQPTASTLTQTACDLYTLNGNTYTTSGTYTQVRTNAQGCDSTITLLLTIHPSTASTLTQTACDSYTLNGSTYTTSGTYTQVRTNHYGCDSTIMLQLTIHPSTASTLTQTACDSYTLNGTTYTTSGTYTQTRMNRYGCDSTITLLLTIHPSTASTLTQTACDSYTLNGTVYTTLGTYTQVHSNQYGCDSTVTLNLIIRPSTVFTLTQTACDSYTLNGTVYTASGTYTQVRPNHDGCDSTILLNLTINHPTASTLTHTACDSYTLNGTVYNTPGTYTQVLQNHHGCDSTITLHLTIHPSTASTLTQTACDSYTLNGTTYNSSGTYTQVHRNGYGCDSTVTLNLTIRPSTGLTLTETACDSYTLNGSTYTTSGVYTQALANHTGCDSTITLNLTINHPTVSTLSQTACDSYSLNGTVYTTSGTYTQVLPNHTGCDSTITLNLTVNHSSSSTLTETACDAYTLNGTVYNSSGSYTQVFSNQNGCDSTVTLHLTLRRSTASTLTQTACDSYTLNGTTYNTSGTYTQTRTNAAGCDSTITLHLTIESVDVSVTQDGSLLQANENGSDVTYRWTDCATGTDIPGATGQTFTATANGSYRVTINKGACSASSVCYTVSTVGIKETAGIDLDIYPNPNEGEFHIRLGAVYPDIQVELYDMNSKLLLRRQWTNTNLVSINEPLSSGMYQVRIHAGGNVVFRTVVRN